MLYFKIILLALMFNICTAFSIYYSGQRSIFKNIDQKNYLNYEVIFPLFIATLLALFSRFFFVAINYLLNDNYQYKISSTSVTAAISASSYIFILFVNYYLLDEKITINIMLGYLMIIFGILICLYK